MAITSGRFVPAIPNNIAGNRETQYTNGKIHTYVYDCEFRKEDPTKIVKWLRRNFGERGTGWDFHLNKKCVIVEIWELKFVTMYEMWIT